jgi:hypothetical protein
MGILRAAKVIPGEQDLISQEQIRNDMVKTRAADLIRDLGDSSAAHVKWHLVANAASTRSAAAPCCGSPPRVSLWKRATILATGIHGGSFGPTAAMKATFTTDDGQTFAIKFSAISPVKPLDSVREEVYRHSETCKIAANQDPGLHRAGMKEGNLIGVGKTLKHAPVTSMPLRSNNQANDVFSPDLLNQLFSSPQGTWLSGPAGRGTGSVIARVVKVTRTEPDVSAAEYMNYRRSAGQQLGDTAIDSLAQASRKEAGVTVHQQTIQRVLGETPQ